MSSSSAPSYLPCVNSSPLLTPAHHPPALCTPPQKSSDSWKVLGVYSVTTKQNHLKTKWAGECAGAIRPLSLCGRGEKRPLRIRGMEGGRGEAHRFNPRVSLLHAHPDLLSRPPPHKHTHPYTFKRTLQRWTCYLKQSFLFCSDFKTKILPLVSSPLFLSFSNICPFSTSDLKQCLVMS